MRFSSFVFDRVEKNWDRGIFKFFYRLDDSIELCEVLELPDFDWNEVNRPVLDAAIFNLHLALGVSYYKLFCPNTIQIRSGALTADQAAFWNRTYTRGLGEFFYKNQVDFRGLVQFPVGVERAEPAHTVSLEHGVLVPFSGGKDSIVTVEMLRKKGLPVNLFYMGDAGGIARVADRTGMPLLNVRRRLDDQLLKLNREGMNGHVPLNAILAFLTCFVALAGGQRWVALSNESSASEGNVDYLGMSVNHQYSKSLEFERDFQQYYAEFVSPSVAYFSVLRPMNELQIAQELAQYPQYFSDFSSCNRNFKLSESRSALSWCGECPKCAFVFVSLAPFVGREELLKIFGRDLLDEEVLWSIYEELLGVAREKPFECVGTPEEVQAAFADLAASDEWKNAVLVKRFLALHLQGESLEDLLKVRHEHAIPEDFLTFLA